MNARTPWALPLLTMYLITHAIASQGEELSSLLSEAVHGGVYEMPSILVERQAKALFENLLRDEPHDEDARAWEQLGFEISTISENGKRWTVLMEKKSDKQGRGFYLFRQDSEGSVGLLVPHGHKDLYTRELGLMLAEEGNFSVVAWNSVPRSYIDNGRMLSADLAHFRTSFFNALCKAFSTTHPNGHMLQIHGFSNAKRKTGAGVRSDIILSSGTNKPSKTVVTLANALGRSTKLVANVYPFNVRELGGTTNEQGKLLRRSGFTGFIHVEMNKKTRKSMRDSASLREKFIVSFEKAITPSPYE